MNQTAALVVTIIAACAGWVKKPIVLISLALLAYVVVAIILFEENAPDDGRFIIAVMTVIGVVLAVLAAVYGDEVRTLLAPARLQLEPVLARDNFVNKNADRGKGEEEVITFHLVVRNLNPGRPAKNCSVKLVKVLDYVDQARFEEIRTFAVPRWMTWAPGELFPNYRTIYDVEVLDLGNLYLSDGEFNLRFAGEQGGVFDRKSCKFGERFQYVFQVVAEGSAAPQVFYVNVRPIKIPGPKKGTSTFDLEVLMASKLAGLTTDRVQGEIPPPG